MKGRLWIGTAWSAAGAVAIVACMNGQAHALQTYDCDLVPGQRVASVVAGAENGLRASVSEPQKLQQLAQAERTGLLAGYVGQPAASGAGQVAPSRQGLLAGARGGANGGAVMENQVVPQGDAQARGLLAASVKASQDPNEETGAPTQTKEGLLATHRE